MKRPARVRAADRSIASHQRNSMHDAGCCDDLVSEIGVEIQSIDRTADIERQWPGLNARQRSGQLRVIQINLDPGLIPRVWRSPKGRLRKCSRYHWRVSSARESLNRRLTHR